MKKKKGTTFQCS